MAALLRFVDRPIAIGREWLEYTNISEDGSDIIIKPVWFTESQLPPSEQKNKRAQKSLLVIPGDIADNDISEEESFYQRNNERKWLFHPRKNIKRLTQKKNR